MNNALKSKMHFWEEPPRLFIQVHKNYAGSWNELNFLMLVDATSLQIGVIMAKIYKLMVIHDHFKEWSHMHFQSHIIY